MSLFLITSLFLFRILLSNSDFNFVKARDSKTTERGAMKKEKCEMLLDLGLHFIADETGGGGKDGF